MALVFSAVLSAAAAYAFAVFMAEQALSSSAVLNTELILNVGGIVVGVCLMSSLAPLVAFLGTKTKGGLVVSLLAVASFLLAVEWGGNLLLGLMRLELVQLTSMRVSIVAKVGKYAAVFPYVHAALVLILSLAYCRGRTRFSCRHLAEMDKADRRKARGQVMFEMRWFKAVVGILVVTVSLLLYHDLYASRPPRISTPLQVQPDANGVVKIKIEDLADGNLHRYAYVTDDGHVVRFFLLNRSGGRKIGVVYDACMMCGDMGYIQEKNEVICIACNVRIFIPSIGKAGGCNPIPLDHKIENGLILVTAEELDKGAKYFSQVVTVKVKDPVTGKELVSRDAPLRYEFKGRTYFFESETSLEKFKAAPESFVGARESRYFRVQGFKGA